MKFLYVADLWDTDYADYWRSSTMRNVWATQTQRDALGGRFRTCWYAFLAALPAEIRHTLNTPDFVPQQGEMVGYIDARGFTRYGKIVSAANSALRRAVKTPLGKLRLTN